MSHTALAAFLREQDAFVLPSVEDACALSTLEAASSGLPIITTPENGAAEVLNGATLELVSSTKVDELVHALRQVQALRADEAERNRALNVEFGNVDDWSGYFDRYISIINGRL